MEQVTPKVASVAARASKYEFVSTAAIVAFHKIKDDG